MELSKLVLQSERGRECRDMINILICLGYPSKTIIGYIRSNFNAEPVNETDLQIVTNRIEKIVL